MRVLVVGGTRFFGIPMVNRLIEDGHEVTIATRGMSPDPFGDSVERVKLNIYEPETVKSALYGTSFDVVIDKMGYGSADIRNILENVSCKKFIHMSTAGVYQLDHMDIKEDEFDGRTVSLEWVTRGERDYDTLKRQAEAALCQEYNDIEWISVRSPFVLGENDYTKRFSFYIDHVLSGMPMFIDNMDEQMCFANGDEAGEFLAYLATCNGVKGAINYCSKGTVSIREIIDKVEKKTGKKVCLDEKGDVAPYNGVKNNSLNLDKTESTGYFVSELKSWLDELIDKNIEAYNLQ